MIPFLRLGIFSSIRRANESKEFFDTIDMHRFILSLRRGEKRADDFFDVATRHDARWDGEIYTVTPRKLRFPG